MKAHQITKYVFAFFGAVLFTTSIILEWRIDEVLIDSLTSLISTLSGHREFIINVTLGLAGGCFIAYITEQIFLSLTIKSKIQNILLQIRHIKSLNNRFYSEISKAKFLDTCLEIKQHFELIQRDMDVLDIAFKHKKNFQKMFSSLCSYTQIILGADESVRYEEHKFETEQAGIRNIGRLRLAECIVEWIVLVEKYSGNEIYQNYCETDEIEVSRIYPEAPTIKTLEKEGKE